MTTALAIYAAVSTFAAAWEIFKWAKERSLDVVVAADTFARHDADGDIQERRKVGSTLPVVAGQDSVRFLPPMLRGVLLDAPLSTRPRGTDRENRNRVRGPGMDRRPPYCSDSSAPSIEN